MSTIARYGLAFALVAACVRPASASDGDGFMHQLWERTKRALAEAGARTPHPPEPVKVTYAPTDVGTWDPSFGDAIDVALFEGDVWLLTAHALRVAELPVTTWQDEKLSAWAPITARDPVGAISVWRDGGELQTAFQSSAHGGSTASYPLCSDITAELSPGRNYFVSASVPLPGEATELYNIECHEFVDHAGWPARAIGAVSTTGTLAIRVTRNCPAKARECESGVLWEAEIEGVGDAFALTDINRDGHIDVVVASAVAPGEPDQARVLVRHQGAFEEAFTYSFAGGIVAMDAADVDSDGDEDVIIVDRYSLWLLNQP